MTDNEKLKNAVRYIENLANGIHPLTGEELTETVFDEPEIIRCLFYVKEVLSGVGKTASPSEKKDGFSLCAIDRERVLQDKPISLSPFVAKIKGLNGGVGPSARKIWEVLLQRGYLVEGENLNGNMTKLPTDAGLEHGLRLLEKRGPSGERYNVVVYDRKGQEMLLEVIGEIYPD